VQVAVGPTYVVEMVNVVYGVWTKLGVQVAVTGLDSFWGTGNDHIGDPKILYDGQSGRWFASILDVTQEEVMVGVSASNDPTGNWYRYFFKADAGNCPDQPILGVNDDKVVLSSNDYLPGKKGCDGDFVGVQYWIIDKAQMLSGASVPFQFTHPDKNLFAVHPVHSLSSTQTEYMVSSTSGIGLFLYSITGTPPNALVTQQTINIRPLNKPPPALQPSATSTIDTGDNRVLDASWSSGKMWISMDDGCLPSGDSVTRACLRLIQLNTNTNQVLQDFDVATPGYYYFYPALRPDSKGNLFVTFGYSIPSINPSLAVATQGYLDPLNTIQQPISLVVGSGPEVNATGYCPSLPLCRFGDYFGASTDPSDSTLVWVAGQYGTQSGWATYIAGLRMAGSQVPLTMSYSIPGGVPSATPLLIYTSSGARLTAQLSLTPTTYYADYGTPWNVISRLGGSTNSEKWETNQQTSGVATIGTAITFLFYHQFNIKFKFDTTGGGSAYSPPIITYSSFGLQSVAAANFSGWVDDGSQYSYQNPLPGSSASERWYTSSESGRVTGSATIIANYIHQYFVSISYSVEGGGSPASPSVLVNSLGAQVNLSLAQGPLTRWLDAASSYTYTTLLRGSTSSERWEANSGIVGTVTSASVLSPSYYHQFLIVASYQVSGGGAPAPPTISSIQFGVVYTEKTGFAPTRVWLDNGARWNFTNPLPGKPNEERWLSKGQSSGVVAGSTSISVAYQHQFFVEISATEGGSISTDSDWYDSGQTVLVSAKPSKGWAIGNWTGTGAGSFSGNSSSISVTVNNHLTEEMFFFPGLVLISPDTGRIAVSVGVSLQTVSGTKTFYLPPGTRVYLRASPASFVYQFNTWSGSSNSTQAEIGFNMTMPMILEAKFGNNYLNIGGIIGTVSIAVIVASFLLRRRLGSS